ncbi:MAG: GGDEF domain-containing protein [Eggerthellaceae bacterium]
MLARYDQGTTTCIMEYRQLPLQGAPAACGTSGEGRSAGSSCAATSCALRWRGRLRLPPVIDIDERNGETHLADQAQRDALTGLLNRQTASRQLPEAFASTVKEGRTGAFVIVDLDDFKLVNDLHGHLCGDRVLSGIGQHLRAAFRKNDVICRWGGDEFIIYCDDISHDDIARRVRALCDDRWETDAAPGKAIALTVSAGIAMVPEHGTRFTAVYERADAALYQAKAEGKARYRVYEPGMQPHIASNG